MERFARAAGWAVFAAGLVAVSVLSLLPQAVLPENGSDKLGHFAAYAALGCVGMLAAQTPRTGWLILAGLTAWGGALELGQLLVEGRVGDWLDLAANAAGASAGILLGAVLSAAVPRLAASRGS